MHIHAQFPLQNTAETCFKRQPVRGDHLTSELSLVCTLIFECVPDS